MESNTATGRNLSSAVGVITPTTLSNSLIRVFDRDWFSRINHVFSEEYMINLAKSLVTERATQVVYPEPQDVFNAFKRSYKNIKVVILGQDPYHDGSAHGLAFSSKKSY